MFNKSLSIIEGHVLFLTLYYIHRGINIKYLSCFIKLSLSCQIRTAYVFQIIKTSLFEPKY